MILWAHNPHIWIVFYSRHSLSACDNAKISRHLRRDHVNS
nr:MAG TPA: Erythromycin esterase [Caudoviricetes sp.]